MEREQQRLVTNRNLSYKLAESIGQRILRGETIPGDILPGEVELGEMYGVSEQRYVKLLKCWRQKEWYSLAHVLVLGFCRSETGIISIRTC